MRNPWRLADGSGWTSVEGDEGAAKGGGGGGERRERLLNRDCSKDTVAARGEQIRWHPSPHRCGCAIPTRQRNRSRTRRSGSAAVTVRCCLPRRRPQRLRRTLLRRSDPLLAGLRRQLIGAPVRVLVRRATVEPTRASALESAERRRVKGAGAASALPLAQLLGAQRGTALHCAALGLFVFRTAARR